MRRDERERPGELLHLGTKKLARIPKGPGPIGIHGDRSRRVKGAGSTPTRPWTTTLASLSSRSYRTSR